MSLLALLLAPALAAQDALPTTADDPPEIVVIAERLRSISARVGRDAEGRFTCSLSGSTGNARLDDRLCRATTDCVRRTGGVDAAVQACVADRKAGLLRRLRRELEARR